MDIQSFVRSECDVIASGFAALKSLAPEIEKSAAIWIAALRAGGKIMFCGNGGSAADAQHLAAELSGRYEADRPGMAGLALTTDTSALTAIANDFGYEHVFARQVEALARPGDVLYAASTSGNSPNILRAAEKAREMGVRIVAATGAGGGTLAGLADVALKVPSTKANHIQEMHIAVGHILCGLAERALNG